MSAVYPKAYLRAHFVAVRATLVKLDYDAVDRAALYLKDASERGQHIFTCGNGGSAATASHFANDLMKMAGARAICLSDMTPTMLAYMNDDGIGNMFRTPFAIMSEEHVPNAPRAVLVAISCSGNSKNVVATAEYAKDEKRAHVIALTGNTNGKLADIADVVIHAPHPDMRVQEDVHMTICHALAGALKEKWA